MNSLFLCKAIVKSTIHFVLPNKWNTSTPWTAWNIWWWAVKTYIILHDCYMIIGRIQHPNTRAMFCCKSKAHLDVLRLLILWFLLLHQSWYGATGRLPSLPSLVTRMIQTEHSCCWPISLKQSVCINMYKHMLLEAISQFLIWRFPQDTGSSSHHPFVDGTFHHPNHHFWDAPMTMETPKSVVVTINHQ